MIDSSMWGGHSRPDGHCEERPAMTEGRAPDHPSWFKILVANPEIETVTTSTGERDPIV
jgi:hypothetical protein